MTDPFDYLSAESLAFAFVDLLKVGGYNNATVEHAERLLEQLIANHGAGDAVRIILNRAVEIESHTDSLVSLLVNEFGHLFS